MNKKLLFVIILMNCGLINKLSAQSNQGCSTFPLDSVSFIEQPWFNNNQYLLDLIDTVDVELPPQNSQFQDIPILGGMDPNALYWIPVKAWVYTDNDGNQGTSVEEVERTIKELNEYFRGSENPSSHKHPHTHIQFYLLCDIGYRNSSGVYLL